MANEYSMTMSSGESSTDLLGVSQERRGRGGNNGHCPVHHWFDHSHYQDGSRFYFLRFDFEQGAGQTGWHWCRNCKAVYYLGQGESGGGRCPNNPSGATWHTQGDLVVRPDGQSFASFRMETETNNNGPGTVTRLQSGWRFCFKCNVMFFVNNGPAVTHCPAGGQHDQSRSDRYLMRDFTPGG